MARKLLILDSREPIPDRLLADHFNLYAEDVNVREDDLSGLDPQNYGTGTRSFSSSNQFRYSPKFQLRFSGHTASSEIHGNAPGTRSAISSDAKPGYDCDDQK